MRLHRAGQFCGRSACARMAYAVFLTVACANSSAFAAVSNAASPGHTGLSPEVTKLLQAADRANKDGDTGVELIELKEAVRDAPQNAEVHARLAVATLNAGDPIAAERILRDVKYLGSPDEVVV